MLTDVSRPEGGNTQLPRERKVARHPCIGYLQLEPVILVGSQLACPLQLPEIVSKSQEKSSARGVASTDTPERLSS